MNNCFLTIITDSHLEKTLSDVENVIKELMRKFRKRVDFYHVKTYSVNPNDENAKSTILRKMENSNATVIIESHLSCEKLAFYEENFFSVNLHEHHIGGKCIIAPRNNESFDNQNELIVKSVLSRKNVEAAVDLAIEKAFGRKSHILVCTDNYEKSGKFIMDELESRGNLKGIKVEYLTIEEFIWQHMSYIPFSDVILTDAFCEKIIATHLSSSAMQRDGYVCCKGEKKNIYLRELLPFDEMNNSFLSGILLSYAYAIEYEMHMPNVSGWLKRAVGIASQRCLSGGSEEYIKEVISAINHRIRMRRTNEDENKN